MDAAARGKNNRRRGQAGERELCTAFTDAFGVPIKRLLGQERDGGHDINLPPFRIESKRRKRVANLYEWLDNIERGRLAAPVVALRADGKEWLAVMKLDDWMTLAREEIAINAKEIL